MTPSKPWATGPSEILEHAVELLNRNTETSRRLAFILVDNAVEQMIIIYLGLPKRINKLAIGRKKLAEISSTFDGLLEALEDSSHERLKDVDLSFLAWNHRVRNNLYHQGVGLTIESTRVQVYIELAKILFKNLFDCELMVTSSDDGDLIGKFIESVSAIERRLADISSEYTGDALAMKIKDTLEVLLKEEALSPREIKEVLDLRAKRNALVHDHVATIEPVTRRSIERAVSLTKTLGNLKHGHRKKAGPSPTYISWQGMKRVCTNKRDACYKYYGGRGITICKKWRRFEGFLEDMGERPRGKQLSRIDVNGNYEWENCEWSTPVVQQNRLRSNRQLTYQGRTQNVTHWAGELGIDRSIIQNRLAYGWSTEEALGRPVNAKPRRLYTAMGKTQSLRTWSEETGIHRDTLRKRIERHGWSVERAISNPVRKSQQKRKR